MNKFLLPLNIMLAIAVAFLLYKQFSNSSAKKTTSNTISNSASGSTIAYFEMDSLENNYEYFKIVRAELRKKDQSINAELNQIKNSYYNTLKEYNDKAATLSQIEQANWQQKLEQLQRSYQAKEQMLAQDMQDESFKKLQSVKKKIEDFLLDYNKDKKYSFIFMNQSDLIYYRDTAYNITQDLVDGLNKLYKK